MRIGTGCEEDDPEEDPTLSKYNCGTAWDDCGTDRFPANPHEHWVVGLWDMWGHIYTLYICACIHTAFE